MTPQQLCDELDKLVSKGIASVRVQALGAGMNEVDFAGTVSGFLIKTGALLALQHGCPKHILQRSFENVLSGGGWGPT
jgi:hypothetical protein